jgi:dUTP pyrophosphatase
VETVNVQIKKLRDVPLPEYAHGPEEDAGFDLRAAEPVRLRKDVPTLVKTGLAIALPPGYEAQIRSRSGLALKEGLYVLNAPATIDPGYRGEIGVILVWNGFFDILVTRGEKQYLLSQARYELGLGPRVTMDEIMTQTVADARRIATLWAAIVFAAGAACLEASLYIGPTFSDISFILTFLSI